MPSIFQYLNNTTIYQQSYWPFYLICSEKYDKDTEFGLVKWMQLNKQNKNVKACVFRNFF